MPELDATDDSPVTAARTAVFVGGSAGGIEALAELLSRLPSRLEAPVFVVLHVGKAGTSVLPAILDRVGALHAVTPVDGESPIDGIVYVAPRDRHMLIEDGHLRLDRGPTEHGLRPAIDPMFRSAAREFGPRAIGVVLSGMLDDGTAGLAQIRAHGGWTIVQQPEEAAFPSMPMSAIERVDIDFVLPVAQIADRIVELTRRPPRAEHPPRGVPRVGAPGGPDPPGMRTDITCPQCGGVLWEEVADRLTLYRCRSGHGFSVDSLLAVQGEGLEPAIWRPIRMLQERGALLRRLAERASKQGRERSSVYFKDQADEAFQRAAEMRRALEGSLHPHPDRDPDTSVEETARVERR
jgi:two-component system chemotaxis response regulator CheB